jgi:hypothetical protein
MFLNTDSLLFMRPRRAGMVKNNIMFEFDFEDLIEE